MTFRQQPSPQGRQRRLLAVAALALILAVLALWWGVRTLQRLGALGTPEGDTAAGHLVSPTPAPAAPTPGLSLAGTPLMTLEPLNAPTGVPTAALSSTVDLAGTVAPTSVDESYVVEYRGCIKHGSNTGTVKGQVFDRQDHIVVGAEVRVTLNDWTYDTPGITNRDGWYEFYLDRGLKVKIVSLRVNGRPVTLEGNESLVVKSQGGCYENINFRQR